MPFFPSSCFSVSAAGSSSEQMSFQCNLFQIQLCPLVVGQFPYNHHLQGTLRHRPLEFASVYSFKQTSYLKNVSSTSRISLRLLLP